MNADWQPIETAPKDRIIHLKVSFGEEFYETFGWWEPTMKMWTSGGMSLFYSDVWKEPTFKDGLLFAIDIISNNYSSEECRHIIEDIREVAKEL